MIITIKNLTNNTLSLSVGSISPFDTLSKSITQSALETIQAELDLFSDKIAYSIASDNNANVLNTATTIYVATSGSDTGNGSIDQPYLTIQKAINSLVGVTINAPVTIQVGAGSFAGFSISGLNVTTNGYVNVKGSTSIVASPTVTGTTSSYAISLSGFTATADQYRGYIVANTRQTTYDSQSGAFSSNKYAAITTNSTTGISIPYVTTAAGSIGFTGAKLDILSLDTIITTPVYIYDNGGSYSYPSYPNAYQVQLETLQLTSTTATPLQAQYGTFSMNGCRLTNNGVIATIWQSISFINGCYLECTYGGGGSSNVALGIGNNAGSRYIRIAATYIRNTVNNKSSQVGIYGGTAIITSITVDGFYSMRLFSGTTLPTSNVIQSKNCNYGLQNDASYLSLNACSFESCTSGYYAIIPTSYVTMTTAAFTGCTTAITLTYGSKCKTSAGVTSTSTTDISVDGVTATLATMRGATPKSFPTTPNIYGTLVFE